MNALNHEPIVSIPEFLAHALELESESTERYRDLAKCMALHNNPDVAALFEQMAAYSELHARSVEVRAQGHTLPVIAPWDFKWNCPEGRETPCLDDVHYLMNRRQALELARHNEMRGRDFYQRVAAHSPDPEVSTLAREMADEEQEHVDLLAQWIARELTPMDAPLEDLDPPHIPE
jgi:rubrerythrin